MFAIHQRSLGFRVHEETEAALHAASLGFALEGLQGRFSVIPARAYKMRDALLYLSRRPRVSGAQLERVLGHATFLFLARRELLSVFSAVSLLSPDCVSLSSLFVLGLRICRSLYNVMRVCCAFTLIYK